MQNSSLPYQNLQTILKRMKYDLSKTSTENSKFINEQTLRGEFGISPEQKEKQKKISQTEKEVEISKKYPSYCKYPEKTLPVEENIAEAFQGYCYYARPEFNVPKSKLVGIWLPSDSSIEFSSEEYIDTLVDRIASKWGIQNKEKLRQNFINILPINSVVSFNSETIGSYQGIINYEKQKPIEDAIWTFMGYKLGGLQGTQWYEEPKDPRTDYQKFIDNLSWWEQLAPFVVISALSLPTSTLLWLELALSVAFGGAIAFRDWEKGEKINAIFVMLLSLLPGTGFFKSFRNVDPKILISLSDDISKATLKNADDVKRFYDDLGKMEYGAEKQKLFTKIATHDRITEEEIIRSLKQLTEDPQQVINLIKKTVGNNRNQFMKLAFSDVVWKKQLGWAGALFLINLGADLSLGRLLTKSEEELLQSIYVRIPESHKREFVYNVTKNPQVVDALKKKYEQEDAQLIKNLEAWSNSVMKNELGDDYEELPEDPYVANEEIIDTPENEKKYRNLGWIPFSELPSDMRMGDDHLFIGNRHFIKPVKK